MLTKSIVLLGALATAEAFTAPAGFMRTTARKSAVSSESCAHPPTCRYRKHWKGLVRRGMLPLHTSSRPVQASWAAAGGQGCEVTMFGAMIQDVEAAAAGGCFLGCDPARASSASLTNS